MSGAVVLTSGGIDSAVCLIEARLEHDQVHAYFIEYGQRHWIEAKHSRQLARELKVDAFQGDVLGAQGIGIYSQLRKSSSSGEPITKDNVVVEGRNIMFLTMAAAYAKIHGLERVIIGTTAEDYELFPDCRPEFMAALELALRIGLDYPIIIETPLANLNKAEVILAALAHGHLSLLANTWSCYDPNQIGRKHELIPCTRCPACELRQRGFAEAGLEDPARSNHEALHLRGGAPTAERPGRAQVQEPTRPLVPSDADSGS